MVQPFDKIFQRAAERKGGEADLRALLPKAKSVAALKRLEDADVLAEMTKSVFRSGFVWKIIENKWPGFEVAFHDFDVSRCAMISEEELEQLTENTDIVRHAKKIQSVVTNAGYILAVRKEHGSFGRYLAEWPSDDVIGLWREMKTRGGRLGGQTGRFVLRFLGKDTPMLSSDVVKALIKEGVIDKEPTSQKALKEVQLAFNTWQEQSGLQLCQISRILACSVP